jgi:hypothetical protein
MGADAAILIGQAQPLAASTSPWWGIPVVAGCFAAAGVLLTLLGNYLNDRRKFAREDAKHRNDRSMAICTDFLNLLTT